LEKVAPVGDRDGPEETEARAGIPSVRMDPMKPPPTQGRTALAPQRRHGKLRVVALMEAGAAVIAERGFQAATMAEVAARAGAPIGSLYRFFPNKEVLADALIKRYLELLDAAFARVDDPPGSSSLDAFVDALLAVFVGLRGETQAVIALLDAHSDWSEKRGELKEAIYRNVAQKLMLRNPRLAADSARDMAPVLTQNIKATAAQIAERGGTDGVVAELREMTRLYLAAKLGEQ
jgi:AcrR family transcriptional regulator